MNKPDTRSRLEARRHLLESRVEESRMRIADRAEHLRSEAFDALKGEAMSALADRSPLAAGVVRRVLGLHGPGEAPFRTQVTRAEHAEEPQASESKPAAPVSPARSGRLLEELLLPVGLAAGRALLLAAALRGVGSGARGVLKLMGKAVKKLW